MVLNQWWVQAPTNFIIAKRRELLIANWFDHGYQPDTIRIALQQCYPQVMTKLKFQLAPKPTKAQKAAQGKVGFMPVATRWIIERSNAWMEQCKSLVKNFERTLANATAKLNLCLIRLMLKRLASA